MTLAFPSTVAPILDWGRKPSAGYSHAAGRFLHGNYDPGVTVAETKRRGDGALRKRLKGKRVCICVGAGGVGKTTTSAALALGLAARGQKGAGGTIDPAEPLRAGLGPRGGSGAAPQ